MRSDTLGKSLEPDRKRRTITSVPAIPIASPGPRSLIEKEIASLRTDHFLFTIQEFHLFCAPAALIPETLREIGRLREVTFREAGEGTNTSIDIDRFDRYFEQLIIWDDKARRIVGGYRIGKGDRIIEEHGISGFYISTLFRIDPVFTPVLEVSIELGRSYIVKEYQKKPLSLFLLWKGILYLLLKNTEYRFLIGPVSIPNGFREASKELTVHFLRENYLHQEFSEFIMARTPFRNRGRFQGKEQFLNYTGSDMSRIEKFIQDMDPPFKLPVLLKKYISVNAEVLGFNVDPLFSNCLDVLIILDLYEVPLEMIEGLSKELKEPSLLLRFQKGNRKLLR
jgi:putative hemolysin